MGVFVEVDDLRKVLDVPDALATDEDLESVIAAIDAVLLDALNKDEDHSTHSNAREAGLGMAVQVWQSRHAPGGQMVGVDLNPQVSPHLLGPALLTRFSGVLQPCMRWGGAVIA